MFASTSTAYKLIGKPEKSHDSYVEASEFNKLYQQYNVDYAEMIRLINISAEERSTLSKKEINDRYEMANRIFTYLVKQQNDVAFMFCLLTESEFRLSHSFDFSMIGMNLFSKIYKERIDRQVIDPLTLLNTALIFYNHLACYNYHDRNTRDFLREVEQKADGYLIFAWMYAVKNTQLKKLIENFRSKHVSDYDIIYERLSEGSKILNTLNGHSIPARKELLAKFKKVQSELKHIDLAERNEIPSTPEPEQKSAPVNAAPASDEKNLSLGELLQEVQAIKSRFQHAQREMEEAQRDLAVVEKKILELQAATPPQEPARDPVLSVKGPGAMS